MVLIHCLPIISTKLCCNRIEKSHFSFPVKYFIPEKNINYSYVSIFLPLVGKIIQTLCFCLFTDKERIFGISNTKEN